MKREFLRVLKLRINYVVTLVLLLIVGISIPTENPILEQPKYNLDRLLVSKTDRDNHVRFIDKTLEAGILKPHSQKSDKVKGLHHSLGGGVCTFDINADGWLDILTVNGSGSTHFYGKTEWWQKDHNSVSLYLNNRDGSFTDITSESGLRTTGQSMGCASKDLDGDLDLDIIILNRGKNELWENTGSLKFSQRPQFDTDGEKSWSTSATFGDFNQDGLSDIYVANYLAFEPNALTFEAAAGFAQEVSSNFDERLHSGQKNQLLINRGDLQFSDSTSEFEIENSQGRGLATFAADLNGDQILDILVANGSNSENKVFIGQKQAPFIDRSTESALGIIDHTGGISKTSFDQESSEVLVSSGTKQFNKLYRYSAQPTLSRFSDVSEQWRLHTQTRISDMAWSPALADYNQDGLDDILFTNGLTGANEDAPATTQGQPDYLLLNNKEGYFNRSEAPLTDHTENLNSSRCGLSGDFNNDGKPDALIATNNGLPRLLINHIEITDFNWVGFILSKQQLSQLQIGSSLTFTTNKRTLTHKIESGSRGLCNQDISRFSFTLSKSEQILKLDINGVDSSELLGQASKINQYNLLADSSEQDAQTISSKTAKQTALSAETVEAKVAAIRWLISDEKYVLALTEVELLLPELAHSDIENLKLAIAELPRTQQISLVPVLLRQTDDQLVKIGIELIEALEDDRLAKWLFHALHNDSDSIACRAIQSLEAIFKEEEAMVLSKYAAVNRLVAAASSERSAIKMCSIKALGESEKYRAIEPLIDALQDDDHRVRLVALDAIGRVRQSETATALINHYRENETDPLNRLSALNSLILVAPTSDLDLLVKQSLSGDFITEELHAYALLANDPTRANSIRLETLKQILAKWEDTKPVLSNVQQLLLDYTLQRKHSITVADVDKLARSENLEIANFAMEMRIRYAKLSDRVNLFETAITTGILGSDTNWRGEWAQLSANELYDLSDTASGHTSIDLTSLLARSEVTRYLELLTGSGAPDERVAFEIIQLLESHSEKATVNVTPEFCANLQSLLSARTGNQYRINALLRFNKGELHAQCEPYLDDSQTEKTVMMMLKGGSQLAHTGAVILASQQDRWARELIVEILSSSSQSPQIKMAIMANLNTSIPPSVLDALTLIFEDQEENLAPMAASVLKGDPNWLANNKHTILGRVRSALDSDRESLALAYAKLIEVEYFAKLVSLFTLDRDPSVDAPL